MSEYIEDRIAELEEKHEALEDGVGNIYTLLCSVEEKVKSLEKEEVNTREAFEEVWGYIHDMQSEQDTLGKGVKENNTAVIKTMREVEKLKCEVRGTEYLDPLTDKPADQSTEEFVKVVRCKDCKWSYWQDEKEWTYEGLYCQQYEASMNDDDYCSRGEKR